MAGQYWQYIFIFLLARFIKCAPVDADVESGNAPPDITPNDFSSMEGTYFIKFYSPKCHHCLALAPKWDGAYRDVGGETTAGFKWANVDCTIWSDFCAENSIQGYPTLRIYQNGKRTYDFGNTGPSQADLRSFAEQYIKIGEKAFSPEYETAPAEVAELDRANSNSEKIAMENAQEAEKAKEAEMESKAEKEKEAEKEADDVSEKQTGDVEGVKESSDKDTKGSSAVSLLKASDFGPNKNVGRWFVLFTDDNCDECESLSQKWENHENFVRSIDGINWGRVDCNVDISLCESEVITATPSLRIYQDGVLAYVYKGEHDTMSLRTFLLHAATVTNFEGFFISGSDGSAIVDTQLEGAGPNQEPNYLSGPVVQRPDYGNQKPKIQDVVKYTLETLGQPIDEDPGKLIFGDSPESHHNFRTWGAPDAPPPPYMEPGTAATYANGKVHELNGEVFNDLVKGSTEPWLLKFFSPKCPHCQNMAAAYEDLALLVKNRLNVAAVNCETNRNICDAENIKSWPSIRLYRGHIAMEDYEGPRTAEGMMNYSEKAWEAQIYPVENQDELAVVITSNLDKNFTTFVYLYDESVMAEDWVSLSKIAANIDKWGGKLYRSRDEKLRELAGIKHRGSAFANVDFIGVPGEGQLKWHDFPWSNIPKKIRDDEEVSKWAHRTKWSLLQYLNPYEQTKYSPYIAVLITDNSTTPSSDLILRDHHKLSHQLLDFYTKRQIEDQDNLRIDRLRQHDKALLANQFQKARHLMKQPIETPVRVDLAFAYIPRERWLRDYAKYVDVQKHRSGEVVVLDFYNGVYLDEFNSIPITDSRDVLDDTVELLRRYQVKDVKTTFKSIRKFKSSMKGIPEPEHRPLHFQAQPFKERDSLFSPIWSLLKWIVLAVLFYMIYSKVIRPKLRSFASRNNPKRNKHG